MSGAHRALEHFLLLSADEQAQSIRRLVAAAWKVEDIARATGLHVEQIRKVAESQAVAKCARHRYSDAVLHVRRPA